MTGLMDRILNYLANYVPEMIVKERFDLGQVSYTAGSIGSVAQTITTSIRKTGYTPIAVGVAFVATSVVEFNAFLQPTGAEAYTQVIRRQSAAYSTTYHAYLEVVYLKNA